MPMIDGSLRCVPVYASTAALAGYFADPKCTQHVGPSTDCQAAPILSSYTIVPPICPALQAKVAYTFFGPGQKFTGSAMYQETANGCQAIPALMPQPGQAFYVAGAELSPTLFVGATITTD